MRQRKSNGIVACVASLAILCSGLLGTTRAAFADGHQLERREPREAAERSATLSRALDLFLVALAQDEDPDPDDPGFVDFEKARDALNRARYKDSAKYFKRVYKKFPQSAYADDALYWYAFAQYKRDRRSDLEEALEALEQLYDGYRGTATYQDAQELEARIHARLAELGRQASAIEIREQAGEAQDDDLRMLALNALLQMDSEAATPLLRRVLEDPDKYSTEMREKAVFILSQKRGPETLDIMLHVARNDPDTEVREKAVFWLSQVQGPGAVEALEEILLNSDDEVIQEKAIFALSQHPSEQSARILRDYVRDASKPLELRENGIFWLSQNQGDENFQFLTEIYEELEHIELKEKVIFSIAQLNHRRSQAWLLDRVRDENESMELRENALFWAGQQGQIPCAELGSLYETFEDHELREKLIFTVAQRGGGACVDILIDIIRTERDYELRKKAIFWLSQTNDPRAVEILQELIEQ